MPNWIKEDAIVKPHHPLKDMSNHAGGMICVCTEAQAQAGEGRRRGGALLIYYDCVLCWSLILLPQESGKSSGRKKASATTTTTHPKQKSKQSSLQSSSGSIPSKGSATQSFPKGMTSIDVKIFSLVGEVTKSKDETIASKNYTIQLLESMLQTQKKCACVNGVVGE